MAVIVKCQACGKTGRLPDRRAGERLRCPRCDATVIAPPPVPGRRAEETEPDDSLKYIVLIGLILVGILLLAIFGVLTMLLFTRDSTPFL